MRHGGIREILETRQFPGITGTRDSFGIGKEFYDKKHGVIDNFKKWERAGYRKPDFKGMGEDAHDMTEMVKEFKKKAKSKAPMKKRMYHETGRKGEKLYGKGKNNPV